VLARNRLLPLVEPLLQRVASRREAKAAKLLLPPRRKPPSLPQLLLPKRMSSIPSRKIPKLMLPPLRP